MQHMNLWFTEQQTDSFGITAKVLRTLHTEQTPYQSLAVLETEQFGRMLVLDGMVQTTERDEFVYHEMIAHVALQTHPCPRRVAVIGGGDGGAVREVLKYSSVEQVNLVEIDRRVVEVSRIYFPQLSSGLDDPRVRCVFADGIEHVRSQTAAYDVIIVDSTEPVGPAVGLFDKQFYRWAYDSLTSDGILVAQTESPFFNQAIIRRAYGAIREIFPLARLYLAAVPTYPSGLWSFTLGSKGPDPLKAAVDLSGIHTRYYTEGVHYAAFQLPRFVQEIVEVGAKVAE